MLVGGLVGLGVVVSIVFAGHDLGCRDVYCCRHCS